MCIYMCVCAPVSVYVTLCVCVCVYVCVCMCVCVCYFQEAYKLNKQEKKKHLLPYSLNKTLFD